MQRNSNNGKRWFAALLGILLVLNSLSLLNPAVVYGAEGEPTEIVEFEEETVTEDQEEPANETEVDVEDEEVIESDADVEEEDEEEEPPVSEEPAAEADPSEDGSADDTEAEVVEPEEADVPADEEVDVEDERGPPEEEEVEAEVEEAEEEEIELLADQIPKPSNTVLCFTSDTHNMNNNTAANRLGSWLEKVNSQYGGVTAMAFGGDMANAGAGQSDYWTFTQADMTQLDDRGVQGVYTTGNHEHSPGNISSVSNAASQKFIIGGEGASGSDYLIYCLGSASSSQSYSSSMNTALDTYLKNAGTSKAIFIITHFPLHTYSGRTTQGAADIVTTLNNAVARGQKIVFLWGHNHTMSDTYYDEIYQPGDTLPLGGSSGNATIQFYYGGAGCMSDQEYGGGSASVKGKGLVVSINSKGQLAFRYLDADGNEIYSFTEQDPVPATGISVNPTTATVEVGRSVTLKATISPSDATNKGVTWSSSNTSVATVSATGKVKGVSQGTATITATAADGGFTARCNVTVTPRTTVDPEYVITINGYALSTEPSPDTYTSSSSGWGSSSTYTGLAGVPYTSGSGADGEIRWILEEADNGGYYIKSLDGLYLNATYSGSSSTWGGSSSGALKLDETEDIWMISGDLDSWELNGSLLRSTNCNRYLSYESSNGDGSKINLFTARSESNADTTYVELASDPVAVTGVTVSPTTATVEARRTIELTATVSPSNATNKKVNWSSSNTSIATVDANGKVRGVAEGRVTITATTADGGKTASCQVTVTASTSTASTYVLTDKLEDGQDYLIANGNSGTVYILSTDAGSSRQLKGVSVDVVGDAITIEEEDVEAKVAFTAEKRTNANSGADSFWISNDGKYLYTNSANGLRMVESSEQGNSDNTAKVWHYRNDRNLLWYFKDTSSSDGYTDTSSTYKYYLEMSGSNFTDNHVSTTSLSNSSNLPKMYLFVKDNSTPQPASGVTLDKNSLSLKVGKTATLTATVLPRNAENKSVTWSTSNSRVATVSNGVVTAVAEGTATITVTTVQGGYTATCQVTVSNVSGTTFVLTDHIEDGGEYLIVSAKTNGTAYAMSKTGASSSGTAPGAATVTIEDETIDTENESIIWTASTKVSGFALTNGTDLFAGKGGTIYIYTQGNDPYADRYWVYDGTYLLYKGGEYTYEVYYSNGSFTDRSFNSGNPQNPVYIYERVSTAAVTSVTVDPTTLSLRRGRTGTVTATVSPSNASKRVTWSSSNTNVATVDSTGKVTAVAAGRATITATSVADPTKSATCIVIVSEPQPGEGTTYVLTDKLEAGKEYLIANGNTGSVYIVSNEAGSSRQLKGVAVEVVGDTITIEDENTVPKVEFTTVANTNSSQGGIWIMNGTSYLYTDSNTGLRLAGSDTQASSSNNAKSWHYKSDSRNDILWFFKDDSTDGYSDTSQTYKYYLEMNGTNFTDNHVSTTSLANSSNLPKIYLFVKDDTPVVHTHTLEKIDAVAATCTAPGNTEYYVCTGCGRFFADAEATEEIDVDSWVIPMLDHTYGEPVWNWTGDNENGYTAATATFTCSMCGDVQVVDAVVTSTTTSVSTIYIAVASFQGKSYTDTRTVSDEPVTYELSDTAIEVPNNSTYQLKLNGSDGSTGTGTWVSADEKIATVDENGLVTAVKYGKTTITVTFESDGKETTATCEVQTRFSDVTDSSAYYYKAVYWAADSNPVITAGYTSGDLAGSFGVGRACTRQEFILFIYRLAGQPKVSNAELDALEDKFTDASELTGSFKKAVAWGVKNGIIKGYTSGENAGKFVPGNDVTRQEALLMLWRYAGKPSAKETDLFKSFKDLKGVKKTSDTYNSIKWSVAKGISKGYAEQANIPEEYQSEFEAPCFGTTMKCQRQDLILFLYRYAK